MQSQKPPRARFDCAQRASFDSTSFRSGRSLPSPTLQRETTEYIDLAEAPAQAVFSARISARKPV